MTTPDDGGTGRPLTSRHSGRWHRIGAAGFGLVLCGFGTLGLLQQLAFFSTRGPAIAGLSTNGLLSTISLAVGTVLIVAGLRGGRAASTALVVFGVAFMASGVANVLVLTTPLNILAFGMPNVIFSLIAGAVLLIGGAWGRFTGRLPPDNPYRQERHPGEGRHGRPLEEQAVDGQAGGDIGLPTAYRAATDVADLQALAEAERAVVRGGATPEQASGVENAARTRSDEDRLTRWRRRPTADHAPTTTAPETPARTSSREPDPGRRHNEVNRK